MKPKALILPLLLIAAVLLSLMAGKVWIAPSLWFSDSPGGWIMAELRVPRALLGLGVGGVLGLSGAVLQGYLRNPLADPTVVGVSSSAALGGVLAILLGLTGLPMFGLAMLGAGTSVALLVILAGRGGGPLAFILAGMVLATLSGALTALIISLAPNPFATSEIIAWLMGALTDRTMDDLVRAAPFMAAGSLILLTTGRALDALTLGEEAAQSLGIHPQRLQAQVALGTGLAIGASVAVTGVVGFVGLIVPHFVRLWVGERPSATLLPSFFGGAILTLIADTIVRLTPGPGEVRLGIAMAAIGAPFFLLLLARLRRGQA
jgi:iron complex transport system permease protein